MSRWTVRREGEVLGYLAHHPLSTAPTIAEHYQRHPDQITETLNTLHANGDVTFEQLSLGGVPWTVWRLTDPDEQCTALTRPDKERS